MCDDEKCAHEAWEIGICKLPYKCADCGHVFTPDEVKVKAAIQAEYDARQREREPKRLIRRVGCGVGIVILNARGQVLMGQRAGSHGAGTWSIPGGWMEWGETFLAAAQREVREETSLDVRRVTVIGAANAVFADEDVHSVSILLLARAWSGTPANCEPHKLAGEWRWCDVDRLPTPLFRPLVDIELGSLIADAQDHDDLLFAHRERDEALGMLHDWADYAGTNSQLTELKDAWRQRREEGKPR
jgi:8-oxo-dGTP diphosphatase